MTDEEIIQHYNKRGTAEQVFDRQNNDFGWAHLPKSFMNHRMGASAEVIHEPKHRIPAYHRHGCKLLPIHRGIAAHGRPLWNQGHGQGQEFPVQIHRRACQVGQNGKAVQTQHLLQ